MIEMRNLSSVKHRGSQKPLVVETKKLASENIRIKMLVDDGTIRAEQADALTSDQIEYLLNRPEKNKIYSMYFQIY